MRGKLNGWVFGVFRVRKNRDRERGTERKEK